MYKDKVIMKGSTDILSDKKVLQLITVIAFFCNSHIYHLCSPPEYSLKHARTGFSQNLQKNTKPNDASMCCMGDFNFYTLIRYVPAPLEKCAVYTLIKYVPAPLEKCADA